MKATAGPCPQTSISLRQSNFLWEKGPPPQIEIP